MNYISQVGILINNNNNIHLRVGKIQILEMNGRS